MLRLLLLRRRLLLPLQLLLPLLLLPLLPPAVCGVCFQLLKL